MISLPPISDYHVHLRQGRMMKKIWPCYLGAYGRILAMPNTEPPILTAKDAKKYIKLANIFFYPIEVLTAIKLVSTTTSDIIADAVAEGILAAKLYPEGVTTNSGDGFDVEHFEMKRDENGNSLKELKHPRKAKPLLDLFESMEKADMVLCLHGEMPGQPVLQRESRFLDFVEYVIYKFRNLRVILEHITTRESVSAVRAWQYLNVGQPCRVAATITPHHLYYTLDDVIGNKIQPWNFCKPVVKQQDDLQALRHAAFSGERCFFLGSDSAPHDRKNKECHEGCAGIFNAPVVAESLIHLFDENSCVGKLPNFMTHFGDSFYRLPPTKVREVKYLHKPLVVPEDIAGMRPFLAGKELNWRRKNR